MSFISLYMRNVDLAFPKRKPLFVTNLILGSGTNVSFHRTLTCAKLHKVDLCFY